MTPFAPPGYAYECVYSGKLERGVNGKLAIS